ncbi:hypothetical protein SAMN05446037_100295 [Anaerovirgula multivorans]|uniref:Cysteine-rich small domain-containing protein n=1 Tax=Anaerovirgula multivorans TaxID=312168 RepID=A0A239AKN4_9FIRM|nr:hypothetical protein [Anaerovirgula multivorans]SNR95902.1 hypothetical protein SAMN05446037_100295 [Anaerovirgula multivorans]
MGKNCDNCFWADSYGAFCVYELNRPSNNFCKMHSSKCECGHKAEYTYNGKLICSDCLLEKFSVERKSFTMTNYYYNGDYLGNDEVLDEVICNLDEDIEKLD